MLVISEASRAGGIPSLASGQRDRSAAFDCRSEHRSVAGAARHVRSTTCHINVSRTAGVSDRSPRSCRFSL